MSGKVAIAFGLKPVEQAVKRFLLQLQTFNEANPTPSNQLFQNTECTVNKEKVL